jgi:hypothetical protein
MRFVLTIAPVGLVFWVGWIVAMRSTFRCATRFRRDGRSPDHAIDPVGPA